MEALPGERGNGIPCFTQQRCNGWKSIVVTQVSVLTLTQQDVRTYPSSELDVVFFDQFIQGRSTDLKFTSRLRQIPAGNLYGAVHSLFLDTIE